MTPTTCLLICEGSCNPSITTVDELARQYTTQRARSLPGAAALADRFLRSHRQLRHTVHDLEPDDTARCTVCGTSRGYGRRISHWDLAHV